MKIMKAPDKHFAPQYVKRVRMGHITEYTEMSAVPTAPPVKKISQKEYINLNTGEVSEYSLSSNRSENVDSLRKTFKRIRALINSNCENPDFLHWVTLTYKENMTDTKQLYSDFDKFLKRFKYFCNIFPEFVLYIFAQRTTVNKIFVLCIDFL